MKNISMAAVSIFVIMFLLCSCSSFKHEPAAPITTLTPVVAPSPGIDGYYSASTAGVTFKWKVNGANLDCKLSAATTGWVAVGFNAAAIMQGADLKIGYVNAGIPFMEDDFGTGHTHAPDTSSAGTSNITGISGTDDGTTTELIFSFPLNSGDVHDYALTQGGSVYLLLSHGANGTDDVTTQHADRGWIQIILY